MGEQTYAQPDFSFNNFWLIDVNCRVVSGTIREPVSPVQNIELKRFFLNFVFPIELPVFRV